MECMTNLWSKTYDSFKFGRFSKNITHKLPCRKSLSFNEINITARCFKLPHAPVTRGRRRQEDPNADTEWNDVLRAKGILPPKQEDPAITEDDIVNLVEKTVQEKAAGKSMADMDLGELDGIEDEVDEEDERMFEAYRRQRMAELRETQLRSCYGEVREITKSDWVSQVNQAGDGVWVVVHVYKQGLPICNLVNQHLSQLAQKFPQTKFLKSISSVCIPNYPDKNLPTIFVYHENQLKKQWVGPLAFGGMNLKKDELEWMLSQVGAVQTDLESNPRREVHDVMTSGIRGHDDDSDDDY